MMTGTMSIGVVDGLDVSYLTFFHRAPISFEMSPTDMDGDFFLMSGRSSWEKMKKADSGRLGALGSLPAFFDEAEAPRGILVFFPKRE
jgi:hypothetical protein